MLWFTIPFQIQIYPNQIREVAMMSTCSAFLYINLIYFWSPISSYENIYFTNQQERNA